MKLAKGLGQYAALIASLLMICMAASADKQEIVLKATRLGPFEVAITCRNNQHPIGRTVGEAVIMSCAPDLTNGERVKVVKQ